MSDSDSTKRLRLPLDDEQREQLEELLAGVPTEKIVRYNWSTDEGQRFINELRRVQLSGVPLNWIAEALRVTTPTLNNAIGYWQRAGTSRGRRSNRRRSRKKK